MIGVVKSVLTAAQAACAFSQGWGYPAGMRIPALRAWPRIDAQGNVRGYVVPMPAAMLHASAADADPPRAERAGFECVLGQATAWLAAQAAEPAGTECCLSLPVSPQLLASRGLAGEAGRICDVSGIARARVVIELPDIAGVRREPRLLDALHRLHLAGFALALGHAGTGDATLQSLARLPWSELVLDATHVVRLVKSSSARAIAKTVVAVAHALGILAVADGVADASQRAVLVDLGYDGLQGTAVGSARRLPRAGLRGAMHPRGCAVDGRME